MRFPSLCQSKHTHTKIIDRRKYESMSIFAHSYLKTNCKIAGLWVFVSLSNFGKLRRTVAVVNDFYKIQIRLYLKKNKLGMLKWLKYALYFLF